MATPGLYLIIGGSGINDCIHEIIEQEGLRQLRDNLTALLADARLASAALKAQQLRPAVPSSAGRWSRCSGRTRPGAYVYGQGR
jgi:hypothetical protein